MSDRILDHIKQLLPDLSTAEKIEVLALVTQALKQSIRKDEVCPPLDKTTPTAWGRELAAFLRSEPHTGGWDDIEGVAKWIHNSRRQTRFPA
jgi:hypothetical protein